MTASLAQIKEEKDTLLYQAETIFREANENGSLDFSQVKFLQGTTEEKIAEWTRMNSRINELAAEYERMYRIDEQMKRAAAEFHADKMPVNSPPHGSGSDYKSFVPQNPTLRQILENTPELKEMQHRGRGVASVEIPATVHKTLLTLADISPQNDRGPLVPMRREDRTVGNYMQQGTASAATVDWYERTTETNAAAEVTEGLAKPESALDYTLRTTPVAVIATHIPVTRQALEDNDFLETEIRENLVFMVQRREEAQLINGNGTPPNLRGILATVGIQTTAYATSIPASLTVAMQLIRGSAGSGFAEPDLIVMHPADVTDLMLLQATTGQFIFTPVMQDPHQLRLWGVPIRQTTAIAAGTALVGDFDTGARIYRNGGLTVTASSEHATNFTENKVTILAEERVGLAVMVPTAFCTVTAIP